MKFYLKQFTIHNHELVAEASELRVPPGKVPGDKLWWDACDYGFIIESDKTGKQFTFVLEETTNNSFFVYKPYEKNCPISQVVIYNT